MGLLLSIKEPFCIHAMMVVIKWPRFFRRHQITFLVLKKYCILIHIAMAFVPKGSMNKMQKASIGWNNGLAPNRWQAIVWHYNDVIMSLIASQITSLTIVYSAVYSDTYQRKLQSSASLAFVRGIHQWPAQRASNAENVSIWWRDHGPNIGL